MSPAALAPRSLSPGAVVALLTLLLGIQPIATDLYLPALPTVQRELGASMAATQLTLSALVVCFGFAQLAWGPVADRWGRRPVLLGGMALYTAASLAGSAATQIETLVAWRALQGVAMAAAVTCGRSIVRDLYEPGEGARVMSRALSGLGVIAALCPLVGGYLVERFDWHAALLALGVFGAGTLAFVGWRYPETVPSRDPSATRLGRLAANWRAVLSHRTFRAWAALSACSYGGLFFLLAGSSFVFIEVLGTSRVTFGALLSSVSCVYVLGTMLCRRLLARHGLRGAVKRAAWFTLAGGAGMAGLSLAGVHEVWAIVIPQYLFAIGHGVHQPCSQAGAIGPFPEKAGTAASLSGFAMTLAGLAVGLWLGAHLDATVYPLTLGIGFASVAVATVAWTLVQRDGEPHREGLEAIGPRTA